VIDAEREREQHRCDERVEPVVVGGEDDRRQRDDGMQDHEVAPPTLRRDEHRPRDHQRPPEVQ
jgi:hypothetical protein